MQTRGTIPNWEVKMLKHMCFAVGVALAAASPAQAVDFLVTGIGTPSGLDDQNSYTSELAGFGLTQLANNPGLSVSLTGPISVNVFSVGAESLYANTFHLGSFTIGEAEDNLEPFPPDNLVAKLALAGDRTRVVSGKSVSVRLDLGGRSIIKKK